MKKALTVFLCFLAFVSAAQAEPVPAYMLNKDFESCMGGESAQQDPERNQECNCLRDTMKGWTLDEYEGLLLEEAKTRFTGEQSPKLQEVVKACVAKVTGEMPQ